MDGSLSSTTSSRNQEASSKPATTRSGLTLVLPSLKNLKAANIAKKSKPNGSVPQSPAFGVDVPEKKVPRPVKLKPLKEVLTKLIQQIKKKDDYAFFLKPVDPSQVPGYLDVVQHPMDFGTMTNKVERGKYRSLEEFANDLKLVTQNAKTFNPSGSIYHSEADRIEAWALDHIAKASSTVIQYETDWNIDIERDDDIAVNIDDDHDEHILTSGPSGEAPVNGRSPSVMSQPQQTSGRRGPRGPYKKGAAPTTVSESIDAEGRLPGSKDGLGAFPPGSDWTKIMLALKLKGKRYKTKKERLRIEKEGPPYLPDGSLDYFEMEDPFTVLSALVPDPLTRPGLTPIYPSLSLQESPPPQTQSVSETSTPQPEPPTLATQEFHRQPTSFPSTINLPLGYDPLPSTNTEIPLTTTYSKRRHWHIVRNPVGRKTKDVTEDNETDELPLQVAREVHPADFGSFAVLAGALSEEMKKRGVTPGILKDGEEEKVVLEALRDSLVPKDAATTEELDEDAIVSEYLNGVEPSANKYFTSQRAAEAEEYIREIVYGGVDGLAYVRSLAEFVNVDEAPSQPVYHSSELGLGMSLGQYIQNLVDELTEGRHSILRETADQLRVQAYGSAKIEVDSVVAAQTAISLHLAPKAAIALQALLQIRLQKIDMSALINKPEELFLSEEEWAGKGLREKRKLQQKTEVVSHKRLCLDDEAMEVEEEEEKQGANTSATTTAFEMEGPEELAEVLGYVSELILELNRRVYPVPAENDMANGHQKATPTPDTSRGNGDIDEKSDSATRHTTPVTSTPEEDPTLRKLRLNLLALAKRAPLDTIARLPLELVPEHIRHYIPTLDASTSTTPSASTAGATTPAYTPTSTVTTAAASPVSPSS